MKSAPRAATPQAALAALPAAAELERRLAEVNETIARDRTALAEVRVEAQAIARDAELADRRLQAIAAERGGLERTQAERRGADRNHRAAFRGSAARAHRAHPCAAKIRRPAPGADRRDRDRHSRTPHRRRSAGAAETHLAEADKAARGALEAVGEARAEAARAEERCAGAKRRRADIEHEIHETLDVEPAEAAELAELKAGAEPPQIADVEATLDRIRRERERLGSVNLIAEQELREVEAQHDKLVSERDDLVEAIRRLRQGIHSLNREARERLLASFAIVNEHFKKLFTELFGGGNADLQLIESDDPLEAGLEIMAKPPGKKPATLSLLSGGEQALTALALIFAVFLTNPAPICVLDEVDAPLDDYNVERFCDLLDEMIALDRDPLHHHHPQPDHHGADEPPLRRHHGRARRVAARLGRPRRRGEAARGELGSKLTKRATTARRLVIASAAKQSRPAAIRSVLRALDHIVGANEKCLAMARPCAFAVLRLTASSSLVR